MDHPIKNINPYDRHGSQASKDPVQQAIIRAISWGEKISIFRHHSRMGTQGLRELFGHDPRPDMIHRHSESINPSRDIALGAYIGGQLRGCLIGRGYSDGGRHGALCSASVEPAFQGQGIGSELMAAATAEASRVGIHKLHGSSRAENLAGSRLMSKTMLVAKLEADCARSELICSPIQRCPKIDRSILDGIEALRLRPEGPILGRAMLAHGEGFDAWAWRARIMPELARLGVESMAISLPGHGSSPARKGGIDSLLDAMESATLPKASLMCVEGNGYPPLAMQISAARVLGIHHERIDRHGDPFHSEAASEIAAWIARVAISNQGAQSTAHSALD